MAFVYFIAVSQNACVKIGFAADPHQRLDQLQVASPFELTLLAAIETDDTTGLEAVMHRRYAHLRIRGEWFRLEGDLATFIEAQSGRGRRHKKARHRETHADRYETARKVMQEEAEAAFDAWERGDKVA